MISKTFNWATAHPVLAVAAAVLVTVALAAGVSAAVRLVRATRKAGQEAGRARVAAVGLLIPAALALGMSADTSYRFLGDALQITGGLERALLCGVAEAAIVALTVYAWATRTKGPAYLAYAAVLVQTVPAFEVSGGVGGPVRVVLGPVLLAVLLHLLLGLELRMSGERSDGLVAAALRELRERVTASLGIGRRGEDSAAIARSRAADRAVTLADKVAVSTGRRRASRAARLAAAIDAARHGLPEAEADAAEADIVARVIRRKSVTGLAEIPARYDWTAATYQNPGTLPQPEGTWDRIKEGRKRLLWDVRPVMPPKPGASAEVPGEVPEPAELPVSEVPPVVPAEVPAGRSEVPPVVVPAAAAEVPQVPAEVPAPAPLAPSAPVPAGTSADVSALVKAGSAEVPAEPSTPARGSATRAARDLIAAGTTDPGTIRERLEGQGIVPPSDRYIRRLVSEARNNDRTGAYL